MGDKADDPVLRRALEAAKALDLNPRIQDMRGLRKHLRFSTQRFNGWKRRGVPQGQIYWLAKKVGATEAELRGEAGGQKPKEEPTGGDMTDQEVMLLMAFRQADEQFRAKFMELAHQAARAKFSLRPRPAVPPQDKPHIA